MTEASTAVPLPTAGQVQALADFLTSRSYEATGRLLPIGQEQPGPDAEELLRIPQALHSTVTYLRWELHDALADETARAYARQLWRTLLSIAGAWRDHPALPDGLRDIVAAAD
jgi:hypothetical protein